MPLWTFSSEGNWTEWGWFKTLFFPLPSSYWEGVTRSLELNVAVIITLVPCFPLLDLSSCHRAASFSLHCSSDRTIEGTEPRPGISTVQERSIGNSFPVWLVSVAQKAISFLKSHLTSSHVYIPRNVLFISWFLSRPCFFSLLIIEWYSWYTYWGWRTCSWVGSKPNRAYFVGWLEVDTGSGDDTRISSDDWGAGDGSTTGQGVAAFSGAFPTFLPHEFDFARFALKPVGSNWLSWTFLVGTLRHVSLFAAASSLGGPLTLHLDWRVGMTYSFNYL